MIKDNQDQDTLKEIASVEIIAKIEKGETIDLDHVRILGDLNISKLNLASKTIERTDLEINSLGLENNILIINSIIKVRNSEILGISNFSELAFSEEFDFSGSEFKPKLRSF